MKDNRKFLNARIDGDLHKRLKMYSVAHSMSMVESLEAAIDNYLESKRGDY